MGDLLDQIEFWGEEKVMTYSDISAFFSRDYTEARGKFLAECEARSLEVESRLNPNAKGPGGEDLFADIARIGPTNPKKALFLMSATHGVEGYCGSGAQVGLLREGFFADRPDDTGVVMLHALNPYGFAHDRRVNEDNIDLNRNFLAFDQPERPQSDYPAIHEHVLPADLNGPAMEAANAALMQYVEEHGMPAFQAAISSGQYAYPDGVFYGGKGPSWSNAMLRSVVADYLSDVEVLGIIDFHTGLGPYGYGELIISGNADNKALSTRWYGEDEVADPEAGTSTSASLDGMNVNGFIETVPDALVSFIAAEFGTRDLATVLGSVRADNWLYHKGDVASDLGTEIKAQIRDAFYPEKDDWKEAVWARSHQVVNWALDGLAATERS